MKTTHKIIYEDARQMKEIKSESVDLMITSPPYPMIEMWDKIFSSQNTEIKEAIEKEDGSLAFELMHKELDKVWNEVYRVLKDGGIACINIGDATRTINGLFKLYPNHSRILIHCLNIGFHTIPEILWRKQTNAPNKFMGSGMLPVGAYVTLEHEYILILRKKGKRDFKQEQKSTRQRSAYFWEERNKWFSDMWIDLKGTGQNLKYEELRDRSGAFPFELAYRLINMFSIQGDTVLDPFLGTGTTTIASITSQRNSIGIEIDSNFKNLISERINDCADFANQYNENRIKKHLEFVEERKGKKGEDAIKYHNKAHDFPVMTRQELNMTLPKLKSVLDNGELIEAEYN